MTKDKIKELLRAVKDGHHSFKECLNDMRNLEMGMVAAIASLATALNATAEDLEPTAPVPNGDSN